MPGHGHAARLMRIAGIDIRIDASWIFIVALVVWTLHRSWFPETLPGQSDATYLAMAVVAALAFFACLLMHELAHSLTAQRFGVRIEAITLFIFGGVAEMKEEPKTARADLLIAAAGPAASLILSGVFAALGRAVPGLGDTTAMGAVLAYLAEVNLMIALFNMVPAFPLDGGRILRAALWSLSGDQRRATRIAAMGGQVFAWFLMITGVLAVVSAGNLAGLWFVLIGMFLLSAARSSVQQMEVRDALHGVKVRRAMTARVIATTPEQTLERVAIDVMLGKGVSFIPVLDGDRLVGVIDLERIRGIERGLWPVTAVAEVMEAPGAATTTAGDASAYEVLVRMLSNGRRKLVVVEGARAIGIITVADVLDYLGIVRQLDGLQGRAGPRGGAADLAAR